MSQPCPRACGLGPRCSEALQHVQHCLRTATFTLDIRTAWKHCAWLTVLCAVVIAIPALMHCSGSYGYAFPQTPKEQSFQPGSGAMAPVTTVPPPLGYSPVDQPRRLTERDHPERDTSALALAAVFAAVGTAAVCMMMPAGGGGGGHRETIHRVPPTWSPENDQACSFRAYMTDISLWVMLTDLQPHQQCAAIVTRLGGSAREVARMISPHSWNFVYTKVPVKRRSIKHHPHTRRARWRRGEAFRL